MNKLSIYLVKDSIDSHVEAIEAIENLSPLEKIRSFNLHIKGPATSTLKSHQITLIRGLGAQPAIYTINHGLYSTVKLSKSIVNSLVGVLQLSENPEDFLICVLSECNIIAMDVDIDEDLELYEESISFQGRRGLPWTHMRDVLLASGVALRLEGHDIQSLREAFEF